MSIADPLAVRIAAAQLSGLSRARRVVGDDDLPALAASRKVVDAGPFTGLIAVDGPSFMSYAVAAVPGALITDATEALAVLRPVFAPDPVRFELVEQAAPGAVDALEAVGMAITARVPLMILDPAALTLPASPPGVEVAVISTVADRLAGADVAAKAFEADLGTPVGEPPLPVDGGSVLARVDGEPAAVASWTQVADGVTEIVGVATLAEHRRRGLGGLVTAHAVRAAAELAGVELAWLTPGDDDACRVYARVGFTKTGTAVHLSG